MFVYIKFIGGEVLVNLNSIDYIMQKKDLSGYFIYIGNLSFEITPQTHTGLVNDMRRLKCIS